MKVAILYIFTLFLVLASYAGYAQYDTSYYVSYAKRITGRFYFSRKFTSLQIKDPARNYSIIYQPNTTLNMGIGATYKSATLNLGYGFGFLNPDQGRGKTRYLDLQFHNYGRKIVLDIFGQFYNGFYLSLPGSTSSDRYYLRPDLHVNEIGVYAQYVLNHGAFSYRASFLQNEWQKRSSGTFLAGVEIYGGWVNADSTIIPTALNKDVAINNPHKLNFFEIGPNVGYAYTYVFKRHFFATASGSISLDYGINTLKNNTENNRSIGFSPNTFLRLFGGYNSARWAISVIYINNSVRLTSESTRQIMLNTGNFRLNYVHRFRPGKKTRRVIKEIEREEKRILK